VKPRNDLTLLELWQAFSTSEFPHLRGNSKRLYEENFAYWMLIYGEHFLVARTTLSMMAQFRLTLEAAGRKGRPLAVRTVQGIVQSVKIVYRWAKRNALIAENPLADYVFKIAKDKRPVSPPEFRDSEFRQLLAAIDPRSSTQWRAFVALALCGFQGKRQQQVLHLKPEDVTLGYHVITPDGVPVWVRGAVRWRPEWDKNGVDETVPLRLPAQLAIEIALEWHARTGYAGEWLIPNVQKNKKGEAIYDQQSLWWALKAAQTRGGIENRRGRGAHGLRKLLAGDVTEVTGDFLLGLRAIGDRDPRRAAEYIQARPERLEKAFAQMDERWAKAAMSERLNASATRPTSGARSGCSNAPRLLAGSRRRRTRTRCLCAMISEDRA
jgi:integrase